RLHIPDSAHRESRGSGSVAFICGSLWIRSGAACQSSTEDGGNANPEPHSVTRSTKIMEHDAGDKAGDVRASSFLTRRNLFEIAGLTIAAFTLPKTALAGPCSPGSRSEQGTSSVMERLSAYMSEGASHSLPDEVLERTKQHVLDTLAAMISGSELLPGR